MTKWTEAKVQDRLHWSFSHRAIAVLPNNTTVFGWEADLIVVSRAYYAREFEIKVSRSDLMGELGVASAAEAGGNIRRGGRGKYRKVRKHRHMSGSTSRTKDGRVPVYRQILPSQFTIVVPAPYTDLISNAEIDAMLPAHAGLIEVGRVGMGRQIRPSPRLRTRAMSSKELAAAARGMSLRYWTLRRADATTDEIG